LNPGLEFIVWAAFDEVREAARELGRTARKHHLVRGLLSAQLGLAALAMLSQIGLPVAQAAPPAPTQAKVKVEGAQVLKIAYHAPPPAPQPGPRSLQEKLERIVAGYGEQVGVAVSRVDRNWVASVGGNQLYPQQSVSKTWVALSIFEAVDQGRLNLDQPVLMRPEDRSVFSQPIASQIGDTGFVTTIRDLLRRALIQSDNAANDKLMSLAGGVEGVRAVLEAKGFAPRIRLGADERHLQSTIAGLVWNASYNTAPDFNAARNRLPREARDAAMDRYLADPLDGASPVAIAQALAALKRGELLSPSSTQTMLEIMAKARTGPRRLRGALPAGWHIAHKTGTGQDWRGASVGINDVALLTAPDGQVYSVAVMIRRTHQATPARLAMMQAVTRAVVDDWEASQVQLVATPPAEDDIPRPTMAP
jgi:beta-lactamase class A